MTMTGHTIKYRLIIATVLSVCAVWLGIFLQYSNLRQEQQRVTDVRLNLKEALDLGSLSALLAQERGLTQSLLANHGEGEAIRSDIDAARSRVDEKINPVSGIFQEAAPVLQQLTDIRRAADQQRTDLQTSFSVYSAIIADANVLASRRLAEAKLQLGAPFEHINAMRDAVERAGRSRGLINGALALRQLSPQTLEAVRIERVLTEDALHRAAIMAPQGFHMEASVSRFSGPRWNAWQQEWRALDANPQGYIQQKSTDNWWTIATAAINDLQSVLDREIAASVQDAEAQMSSIQQRVYWAVTAMVVLGLASLGLLLSSVARVVSGLGQLVGGIELVSHKKDLGARIPIHSSDEFGQIGQSVNTLVGTIEGLMAEREAQARLDGLTRVLNRKGLEAHLSARTHDARKAVEPFGLLVFDIDHFKRVNDDFGHLQGDAVLVGVAEVARRTVRPDDVVGRWGGEEFVVILSGGGGVDLSTAAEKLRVAVAETDFGIGRQVTVSVGASIWQPGTPVEDAFRRADEALYQAKAAGRNRSTVA